jgi:hypothetical protein
VLVKVNALCINSDNIAGRSSFVSAKSTAFHFLFRVRAIPICLSETNIHLMKWFYGFPQVVQSLSFVRCSARFSHEVLCHDFTELDQ